ncbi:MAG TPA: DNA cytosine methyltransferase [Thermoanaerobaculia bacterium]|nr:DNA cytosine methyltransferase [Thermoanaerobaculia bacterium]
MQAAPEPARRQSRAAPGTETSPWRRGARLRRLTPRECERLMTWPDDWTRFGRRDDGKLVELSDRARYTLCGNGVVTATVQPILDHLTHT